MRKIPTMFQRDETARGHPVVSRITPGCEWVLADEGIATAKLDGANVRVTVFDERLLLCKRRKPPEGEPYTEASYVACDRSDPSDRWFFAALEAVEPVVVGPGIYEALGPHFQGNPHGFGCDRLVRVVPVDSLLVVYDAPRAFDALRDFFAGNPESFVYGPMEGLVFVHQDGRMAKIKRRDFGLPWPLRKEAR